MTPEGSIQSAAVEWFKYKFPSCLIISIPNGSYLGGKNRYAMMNMLKKTGLCVGVPDLFIPESKGGYHGLFIEMKAGKNKPTENQKIIMETLIQKDYRCEVCYSLEDFMQTVMSYMCGKCL